MQKIYRNSDCDLKILDKKTIAVVGFGNQGRAHALNLKDSGANVIIGLHEASKSANKALEAGFEVLSVADATKRADVIMILAPDERQAQIYINDIEPNLDSSKAIAFAHGFSIHYGQINPPKNVDVFMIAPKGPGIRVRDEYVKGSGIPSLVAIYQDFTGNCLQIALAYGAGIGSARVAMIETTFEAETQTDLFGEQAVLCGGVCELMKAGFETLVEAGYSPENAYFECIHELKYVVDLIHSGGFDFMHRAVSDTAEYGGYIAGKRIVTEQTKDAMKEILRDIENGTFAKKWMDENKNGRAKMNVWRESAARELCETSGAKVRGLYSKN